MNNPTLGADLVRVKARGAPFFPVRKWALTLLQGPLEQFHDYDNWVTVLRNSALGATRYIELAPQFGMNGIELLGRPNEGGIDLDWLVTYRDFPRAKRAGLCGELVRQRTDVLRELATRCKRNSLEFWIWNHEWYVPPAFYEAYPEIAGVDYPICFSHPLIREVIGAKVHEYLDAVPETDGLTISMSECSGIEIIVDGGCRCTKCRKLDIPSRLRMFVEHIYQPLRTRGKKLVLRTFSHARYREVLRHTELDHIREAFRAVPPEVMLMSKYCPGDFYGYEYPDDPLIGAFPNPHLVEFSLNRELIGGTYTPNLTPNDFKQRFQNAAAKKCLGVVGRTDNPTMVDDPYLTLDHPNAFNLYCFGRLAIDPETSVDEIWDDYLCQRYPKADPKKLRRVLEPTEEMAPKIYLTLGNYGISYAHRVPHPRTQIETTLEFLSLAKWRADKLAFHKRIQGRDASLIPEVLREKDEAIALAQRSQQALEACRDGFNNPFEYLQLKLGLLRSEQAARFWKLLSEVFFVARSLAADTLKDHPRLFESSLQLLDYAGEIRRDFGRDAWPTMPGPGRGVSTEQFVVEAHRDLLYGFLGQTPPTAVVGRYADYVAREEIFPRNHVEHLWRVLMGCVEPDRDAQGTHVNVHSTTALVASGRCLRLESLQLPLRDSVEPISLKAGDHDLMLARLANGVIRLEPRSCTPKT